MTGTWAFNKEGQHTHVHADAMLSEGRADKIIVDEVLSLPAVYRICHTEYA